MDHLEIITFGTIFVTSRKCFFISDLVQKFARSHVERYGFFCKLFWDADEEHLDYEDVTHWMPLVGPKNGTEDA